MEMNKVNKNLERKGEEVPPEENTGGGCCGGDARGALVRRKGGCGAANIAGALHGGRLVWSGGCARGRCNDWFGRGSRCRQAAGAGARAAQGALVDKKRGRG